MNPIVIAARGKGSLGVVRRVKTIGQRYGLTPSKMAQNLGRLAATLKRFQCGATFPITTAALARSGDAIGHFQERRIEFAVHGLYHVDHRQLSLDEQLAAFARARRIFAERGVGCYGFRSPYLRWSDQTVVAIGQSGFLYDSSQALAWDVASDVETEAYRRVLTFYGARSASAYPALPHLSGALVRIPYCLPDDEALVDRFQLAAPGVMTRIWQSILTKTHHLGELFTLGLHPERTPQCATALAETLGAARALRPHVWIARLDEIAQWWKARAMASVTTSLVRELGATNAAAGAAPGASELHLSVGGPAGTTILARGVELLADSEPWDGAYRLVRGGEVALRADRRPFIGLSRASAPNLASFLRQQGFIVEVADGPGAYALYLDQPQFAAEDERPLLAQLEGGHFPLVRLGRWPDGARSALCITGDIDALTLWDYGLRFLGR